MISKWSSPARENESRISLSTRDAKLDGGLMAMFTKQRGKMGEFAGWTCAAMWGLRCRRVLLSETKTARVSSALGPVFRRATSLVFRERLICTAHSFSRGLFWGDCECTSAGTSVVVSDELVQLTMGTGAFDADLGLQHHVLFFFVMTWTVFTSNRNYTFSKASDSKMHNVA